MAEMQVGAALSDTIEMRSDESLDVEALQSYFAGRLEGADEPLSIRQFGGGHANLTYLLRFGSGASATEYVLRRPPHGPVAKGAHDMKREFRALVELWKWFPLAPRAYLLCEDAKVLGSDFFVMERRRGIVVRSVVPPEFGSGEDPTANRQLSEMLVDTLVDFHAVEAKGSPLETLGRPDGFLRRQVEGWGARYERSKTRSISIADELFAWLDANLPVSAAPTLLHNDWKLDNMAVNAEDPSRCVAVYDWDMCTRGDPLCDVGTLMSYWANPGEVELGPSAMPTTCPGFLSREDAVRRYAEKSSRDLSGVEYYLVFGTFKMAVVLQQIYFRFHSGQTRDSRFAGMETAAEMLFELAASRRP